MKNYFKVGETPPRLNQSSAIPFNQVLTPISPSSVETFFVSFNVHVIKPVKPAYIRIFSATTQAEVFRIDSSSNTGHRTWFPGGNNMTFDVPIGKINTNLKLKKIELCLKYNILTFILNKAV